MLRFPAQTEPITLKSPCPPFTASFPRVIFPSPLHWSTQTLPLSLLKTSPKPLQHRALDHISIARGTSHESNLPKLPALASSAVALFFRGWRNAWHGAVLWQTGDGRGVCACCQRVPCAPGRRTDNLLRISSARSREHPSLCVLPAAGTGEAELQASPCPLCPGRSSPKARKSGC